MLQIPGDTPNAYVVGIGYRRGPLIETLAIRSRDYTPTRWPLCEDVLGKGMGLSEPVVTGGGPAFLRFIRRELQPWVTSRFAADPADATIVGISFGGLFSTYTLLNEPDAFQRYIICSPSLFYDGELMLQHESAYAACHEDLRARVFMACGGLENRAEIERTYEKYPPELKANFARFGRVGMVELLEPFVERLRGRGYAGLRLAAHVFADEHHSSVFPAAVSRGLREVFQP